MMLESIKFRLGSHGTPLIVKYVVALRVLVVVPKPNVNRQESNHGIRMVTCVKSASVYTRKGKTERNVRRQHVRNAKM